MTKRYGAFAMQTSAEQTPDVLVDTSVAVALAVADHEAHIATANALHGRTLGLSGHAWFETFSVLTRLPPPARRLPGDVVRLLEHNFPYSRFLGVQAQRALADQVAELGIAGGAVYDALVGAAAVEYGMTLVTRDRRAVDTYRSLNVAIEIIS